MFLLLNSVINLIKFQVKNYNPMTGTIKLEFFCQDYKFLVFPHDFRVKKTNKKVKTNLFKVKLFLPEILNL